MRIILNFYITLLNQFFRILLILSLRILNIILDSIKNTDYNIDIIKYFSIILLYYTI